MSEVLDRPTERPCENCGTGVVAGPVVSDDPAVVATGEALFADWCPNLACVSNHVIPGLARIGVRDYVCSVCGAELVEPISQVLAHGRTHLTAP